MNTIDVNKQLPISKVKSLNQQVYTAKFNGILTYQGELKFIDEYPFTIRILTDKSHFAVTLSSGFIKIYSSNLTQNTPVYVLAPPIEDEGFACTDCRPFHTSSNNGKHKLLAVYSSGSIALWYYTGSNQENRLLWHMKEERENCFEMGAAIKMKSAKFRELLQFNEILCCDISYDSQTFITGGEDSVIRVYSLANHKLKLLCRRSAKDNVIDGHSMKICVLKYHPRGEKLMEYSHIFISGGWDKTIQIWDDRFGHSLWVYYGPYLACNDSLDIDPEFNHILTSCYVNKEANLQVWSFVEDVAYHIKQNLEYKYFGTSDQPMVEILEGINSKMQQGFIAKWISSTHMLSAGRNNKVIVYNRSNLNVEGTVEELNGILSIAYLDNTTPFTVRGDSLQTLLIATGSKVLFVKAVLDK